MKILVVYQMDPVECDAKRGTESLEARRAIGSIDSMILLEKRTVINMAIRRLFRPDELKSPFQVLRNCEQKKYLEEARDYGNIQVVGEYGSKVILL
jgi:hypothetical protein